MELLELLVPAFVFAVGLPSIVVSLTPVRLIEGYQRRLEDRVAYPVSAERVERISYRRCLEYQVRHLARVILGEQAEYRAFLVR